MSRGYYRIDEALMISLLVGRVVRFFHEDYGIKIAKLVSVVSGKNHSYAFRNNEHEVEDCYIVDGARIFYLDYDWFNIDNINDVIDNRNKLQIRKDVEKFYSRTTP